MVCDGRFQVRVGHWLFRYLPRTPVFGWEGVCYVGSAAGPAPRRLHVTATVKGEGTVRSRRRNKGDAAREVNPRHRSGAANGQRPAEEGMADAFPPGDRVAVSSGARATTVGHALA